MLADAEFFEGREGVGVFDDGAEFGAVEPAEDVAEAAVERGGTALREACQAIDAAVLFGGEFEEGSFGRVQEACAIEQAFPVASEVVGCVCFLPSGVQPGRVGAYVPHCLLPPVFCV